MPRRRLPTMAIPTGWGWAMPIYRGILMGIEHHRTREQAIKDLAKELFMENLRVKRELGIEAVKTEREKALQEVQVRSSLLNNYIPLSPTKTEGATPTLVAGKLYYVPTMDRMVNFILGKDPLKEFVFKHRAELVPQYQLLRTEEQAELQEYRQALTFFDDLMNRATDEVKSLFLDTVTVVPYAQGLLEVIKRRDPKRAHYYAEALIGKLGDAYRPMFAPYLINVKKIE